MKKLILLSFFAVNILNAHAQVTGLDEKFNSNCAVSGENYPNNWSEYDIYSYPKIAWTCGPTEGRGTLPTTTSPGIMCNNYDDVNFYVDTAWLFTPLLNLNWISGDIYLQFDSKFTNDAARLSLLVSNNYQVGWPPDTVLNVHTWYDVTSATTPVLGNTGSSDWVTHVVDLTPYKASPMYVAFRYTSNATSSGTWIIDNVLTTQVPFTGVPVVQKNALLLSVVGNSTPDHIKLSYNAPDVATYKLEMYDIMGRIIHQEAINAQLGASIYDINGLDLHQGMYLLKMDDGANYSIAKVMIR